MSKHQKGRLPPFVALIKETLDAPAWRAMSHGARSLYTALKRRYNSTMHNNGRLYISQRIAAQEIGSSFEQIARWFRELQYFGFIVQTKGGSLGVDGKGKAPHWRLTEVGYMRDPPTRDFMKWGGVPFEDHVRPRRKKQIPVTENRNTPLRKTVTPLLRKTVTPTGTSVAENRNIRGHPTVAENRNISSLTTCTPSIVAPDTVPSMCDGDLALPPPANASPGDERHTRKSLMQYVANVINEQLHELDPQRVHARRRAEAARRPAPLFDTDCDTTS
jgi:hypothetical protein